MSAADDEKAAAEYKLQHEIQKTHVDILNKAGGDGMNYAAALKAKLKFDKVARKFLLKYDSESKLMQFGANAKIKLNDFVKVFEKEFIPEFSEKIFNIIYEYNLVSNKEDNSGVKEINLSLAASLAVEETDNKEEKENTDNNNNDNNNDDDVIKEITRLDCQRFIKSSKEVRKHIREKSLMPLSRVFQNTQFSDISTDVSKVNYEQFSNIFQVKLGQKQCEQAFNLMKDKNNEISIVAYNNFRDKGFRKMLGPAINEEHDENENENDEDH